MGELKTCLGWLAVVLGVLSALAWWRSATARVPHAQGADANGGFRDASFAIDGADLMKTMRLQSKWNRCAAILASLCALTQALATGLPHGQF